jgi:hypothetical protein
VVNDGINIKRQGKRVKASLNRENGGTNYMSDADIPRVQDQLVTLSGLIQRAQLGQMAGLQYGGARDLYTVFGYKKVPTEDDYLAKYQRQDITSRIIDAPPSATWSNPPEIVNTAMQTQWKALDKKVKLWPKIHRADRMARLYPFSIILLGFDDSGRLSAQVNPEKVKDLMYVRPIGSRLVDEITYNTNPRSPRFGFPETYRVKFDDPNLKSSSGGNVTVKAIQDLVVHHSRVVHVVENPLEDEVFGIPIIEKVYNLLDDLLKVGGGTSETYWLSGRNGLQANVDKDMEISPEDAADLSDEIDEYMHQLRRFIRTRGIEMNVLDSKTPNPKEVFAMIINLISGTTGIPSRILLGSEAGQLASEQDRANWAERIDERRSLFAEPSILEPMTDILQNVGLLDGGDIVWEWPSAFIQNPLEIGQTQAQTARAIGNISRQTGNKAPMQLTSREEARAIIGLEGDLEESDIIEPPEEPAPLPFGGGDSGSGSRGETNRVEQDEDNTNQS